MSDIMLHGVLNMPPELWSGEPIDVMQRHSRYVQASKYIYELIEQRDGLKQSVNCASDLLASVTEQRDRLAEEIIGWRNKWECAVDMAARAEVNRDRLAEALKEYREALSNGPENCSYKMYEAVDEFAEKALAAVQDEQ